MREHKSGGGARTGETSADEGGATTDPKTVVRLRMQRAAAYNKAHPDRVEDFNRLTGGVAAKGVRAIMAWQRAHGLEPDGKVGPETLNAAATAQQAQHGGEGGADSEGGSAAPNAEGGGAEAQHGAAGEKSGAPEKGAGAGGHPQGPVSQAAAGGAAASDVSFTDEEAGTITADGGKPEAAAEDAAAGKHESKHASIGPEPAEEGGGLADELVAGGNTASEEHHEEDPEEAKEEGGKAVSEGVEHGADAAGVEGKAMVGVRTAAQIAKLPHVIHLVKAHKYKEAIDYIRETLGYADYVEVIKLVAEHAGLDLAEILPKVTKAFTIGAETADIVLAGLQFQYEALKALDAAHEKGERDNRVYLYTEAWAGGFLEGSYSNPGAVDEKQREAVANGLREGKATAGHLGERAAEVGKQLLKEYGNERNAKRAIIDALLKHAGIDGIKLHEGK